MDGAPLVTGALAERARAAAGDIVAALERHVDEAGDDWPFLAGGSAGTALVLGTWAAATNDEAASAAANRAMDAALDGAASAPLNGDLYAGILGVGWALANLERLDGPLADDERDDELLAAKVLSARPWPGVHDLTRGLVGLGIHALELWPGEAARRRLASVVECLAETARPAEPGVQWWTDPSTVLAERAAQYPTGYVDLGVAHGQAGVVALLAVAASLDIDGARSLAVAAAEQLISWRHDDSAGYGRYPSMGVPDEGAGSARLAWCYGDPGIGWALQVAGQALGDSALCDEAIATARAAARRPIETAGVRDAGLCHGALGVAHALACVGENLGDEEVVDSARTWLERGLALRRDSRTGVAGFVALTPGASGELEDRASTGLLEGAGGVALALLSATTGGPVTWDRFLMPQRPAS